jgi:uncharacterized protein YcgI (DUF1989 family)
MARQFAAAADRLRQSQRLITVVDEGAQQVSVGLVGRTAIKAERLRSGEGAAFEVLAGQVVQVIALVGKQAASLVAFTGHDHREHLSVAQTRARNNSIMLELGMSLYSNRDNALLQVSDDSVKRHDLLHPLDAAAARTGDGAERSLASRLAEFGIEADAIPDPVNLFMKVSILQRGAIEIQESLAEKGDSVMLLAVTDCIVGIAALPGRYGGDASSEPDVLVRVFD